MKKQRIQLAVILALLIVFAGGYFGLKNYNDSAKARESEPKYTALSLPEDGTITELKVKNVNGDFEFKKEGDDWKLVSDTSVDVDESKISSKLDKLKSITSDRVIESPENLADYGLEDASLVISFTLEDGSSHTVKVGDYNSAASMYYMIVDDDTKIYTTDATVHTSFIFTTDQITASKEE